MADRQGSFPASRRSFIKVLSCAAATWPLSVGAQQDGRVRWIGVLMIPPENSQVGRDSSEALEEGLQRLSWIVGRNLALDYRWGVDDLPKARSAIERVLRLPPDLILANGRPALTAAQQATRSVPIVFTGVSEPVERGFVASLARPGGNITGFSNLEATMGGKWLELLKEIALSTPEQKCIGLPEQECISDAGKRAPNWGFFIWHQA